MNKECKLLFELLFTKLDLINVPDEIKNLYHKKIELLELEFKRYMYTSFDNQTLIDKISFLNQELNGLIAITNNNEIAVSNFINNKIDNYEKQKQQHQNNIYFLKKRIIAYLLTLSFMLSSSAILIKIEKNKTKEVLYNTYTYTYRDDLNLSPDTNEYSVKSDVQGLLIEQISPWHIEGNQGIRTIDTYQINNMDINEIIETDDFAKIVANLDYTTENEYKYKNELRDYDRYEEPIYRVIYRTQDYNDYITRYPHIEAKIIALLFTNLLIYMLMLSINKGPFIESFITNIRELKATDKNIGIDYEIINSLKKTKRISK